MPVEGSVTPEPEPVPEPLAVITEAPESLVCVTVDPVSTPCEVVTETPEGAPVGEVVLLDGETAPDEDTHCIDAGRFDAPVVFDTAVPSSSEPVKEEGETAKQDIAPAEVAQHCDAKPADPATLLADMGYRLVPTAESTPVIDWTAKAERKESAPARASWGSDFVNGLGQRPHERGPNPAMAFKTRR
jgi:hypothetical protein